MRLSFAVSSVFTREARLVDKPDVDGESHVDSIRLILQKSRYGEIRCLEEEKDLGTCSI